MYQPIDLKLVAPALATLKQIESELNADLIERGDIIRASLVALVASQHAVLLGPPGTGKSLLINQLGQRITFNGGQVNVFSWLLTKFSTPEELFGPVSVQGLKNDQYRRITTSKLPEAELAFLDEIFKANSAILNALLTVLNERQFDNGPTRMPIPLISLFGASNEMPQGEELNALWDRFLLRFIVEPVSDAGFMKLLTLGGNSHTPNIPTTLPDYDLMGLQATAQSLPIPPAVIQMIIKLRKELATVGITASDRRWKRSLSLLKAHALIEERGIVDEDDLEILKHVMWSEPSQRAEIGRVIAKLIDPLSGQAVELKDQAASVHEETMKAYKAAQEDEDKTRVAIEGNNKLKKVRTTLRNLYKSAQQGGHKTKKIIAIGKEVKLFQEQVAELITGSFSDDMF